MPASSSAHSEQLHTLYSNHHGWLFNLLKRRLGCSEDAADLAQDAFARLLLRPREFDNFGGARAYLTTVAKGLCVDLWRRRDVEQAWLAAIAAKPDLSTPSPERSMMVLETLFEVDRMLASLPVKVARAFTLAQLDGLKYREIALRLGVSERMVKKYMARAMYECALLELNSSGVIGE